MKASKILLDFVNSYKNKKIIICGHERPDADSTSSQFALQFLLNALGICEVYCVKQSPYQRNLAPLLSAFKTIDIEDIDKQSTLVCVDCSSMSRISKEIQSKLIKKPNSLKELENKSINKLTKTSEGEIETNISHQTIIMQRKIW